MAKAVSVRDEDQSGFHLSFGSLALSNADWRLRQGRHRRALGTNGVLQLSVRTTTDADDPAMLVFARHFYESLPYADIEYDEDSCIAWLAVMRRDGVLLLAESDGLPAGFAGGMFTPFIFNINVRVGGELMWWIEPEHRGSGIGLKLLKALENAAYTAGARRWSMIAIEGTAERVSRIYDQMGYTASERTYSKVPTWRH